MQGATQRSIKSQDNNKKTIEMQGWHCAAKGTFNGPIFRLYETVTFISPQFVFRLLRKSSEDFATTSEIVGRLRVNFGRKSTEYNLGLIVLLSSNQNPVILLSVRTLKTNMIFDLTSRSLGRWQLVPFVNAISGLKRFSSVLKRVNVFTDIP